MCDGFNSLLKLEGIKINKILFFWLKCCCEETDLTTWYESFNEAFYLYFNMKIRRCFSASQAFIEITYISHVILMDLSIFDSFLIQLFVFSFSVKTNRMKKFSIKIYFIFGSIGHVIRRIMLKVKYNHMLNAMVILFRVQYWDSYFQSNNWFRMWVIGFLLPSMFIKLVFYHFS